MEISSATASKLFEKTSYDILEHRACRRKIYLKENNWLYHIVEISLIKAKDKLLKVEQARKILLFNIIEISRVNTEPRPSL